MSSCTLAVLGTALKNSAGLKVETSGVFTGRGCDVLASQVLPRRYEACGKISGVEKDSFYSGVLRSTKKAVFARLVVHDSVR